MHPLTPYQNMKLGFFRKSFMVDDAVGIKYREVRLRTIDRGTQGLYNEVIFLGNEAIFG